MRITDKIDVSNHIREGDSQGKSGVDLGPQKAKKNVIAAAEELLEVLELEEADVFTISEEFKNAVIAFSQKTEGQAEKPGDRDIKTFIQEFLKDRALKGEAAGADISQALNVPDPREADIISISREMNSLLKSVIIAGSGGTREIYIPQGAGVYPFLTLLLNELFPGWRIRLLKTFRRKRKPLSGKKAGEGEDGGKEAPGEAADHCFNNVLLKGYHTGRITFSATGLIRTADRKDLKFSLELNATPRTQGAEEGIRLDPLRINYGGPASELDDMRFTFGTDSGDPENPPFSGGAGCLIIDLTEVGKAGDGSAIYGFPNSVKGPWTEE